MMRNRWAKLGVGVLSCAITVLSASASPPPIRAAVLDFQDLTGLRSDALLGGAVDREALAEKGVFLLNKALANRPAFALVDRRDLLAQMERLRPMDEGRITPTRPTFLHAAQVVRADVVLRGSLLAFSPGKQIVTQGGTYTELSTLSLRVGVEALDAVDGSVIAAEEGVARRQFRQSEAMVTVVGEDEILDMMAEAIREAVPGIERALAARAASARARPTARLTLRTEADPALVEIDGVLVGNTPMEGLLVYRGDHVLSITKPGYRAITKRILVEEDTSISVPMLREVLTADELKQIYEKLQLNIIRVEPGLVIETRPLPMPLP